MVELLSDCSVEVFISLIKKSSFNFCTYHLDIIKIHIKYVDIVIHNTIIGMIGLPLYLNLLAFCGSMILNSPIKKYLGIMVIKVINPV